MARDGRRILEGIGVLALASGPAVATLALNAGAAHLELFAASAGVGALAVALGAWPRAALARASALAAGALPTIASGAVLPEVSSPLSTQPQVLATSAVATAAEGEVLALCLASALGAGWLAARALRAGLAAGAWSWGTALAALATAGAFPAFVLATSTGPNESAWYRWLGAGVGALAFVAICARRERDGERGGAHVPEIAAGAIVLAGVVALSLLANAAYYQSSVLVASTHGDPWTLVRMSEGLASDAAMLGRRWGPWGYAVAASPALVAFGLAARAPTRAALSHGGAALAGLAIAIASALFLSHRLDEHATRAAAPGTLAELELPRERSRRIGVDALGWADIAVRPEGVFDARGARLDEAALTRARAPLAIAIDRRVPGATLAAITERLTEAGHDEVYLAVERTDPALAQAARALAPIAPRAIPRIEASRLGALSVYLFDERVLVREVRCEVLLELGPEGREVLVERAAPFRRLAPSASTEDQRELVGEREVCLRLDGGHVEDILRALDRGRAWADGPPVTPALWPRAPSSVREP
ncbi:MAG: hypothetical protein KF729_00430 [Sandaracinaceae bacterium]|nr:hypothetical protein [Sandaracinaceae bacterium]